MKKYIIGTIFGFVLATAVGANAQEVNKVIDSVVQGVFPVTVEGNSVGDAIVVNDKTYLPVREFGEAVGYKVTFTEDREVVLTKNEVTESPTTTPTSPVQSPNPSTEPSKEWRIEDLQSKLKIAKTSLSYVEQDLKEFPTEENQKTIDRLNGQIADYESQIAALEAQK